MKAVCFMIILMLGLCNIYGQNIDEKVSDKFKAKNYNIFNIKFSPNSNYTVFSKAYESSSDTIVLVANKNPDVELANFSEVPASSVGFTKKENLFFRSGKKAILLQLPSQKKIEWDKVQEAYYSQELNKIIILKDSILSVADDMGRVGQSITDVVSIKLNNNKFYCVRKKSNGYHLLELQNNSYVEVHNSENKNMEVLSSYGNSYIIADRDLKNGTLEFIFKNTDSGYYSKMTHNFDKGIKHLMDMPIFIDDKRVFLNMVVNKEPKDKTQVELWYANDKKIEKMLLGNAERKIVIWEPYTANLFEVANDTLTHSSYIGNSNYLISYDPYKNKDFINEFFPYTIYRYNINTKKHEFLAEMGSAIYSSPAGDFLLSQKKTHWQLVEVETGKNIQIPIVSQRMAYFSSDGQEILFENKNSFSIYNIKKEKLRDYALPEGFRNKLVNAKFRAISPGLKMYETTYSNKKDNLFHLWNSDSNQHAVALMSNNKLRYLISPTNDNISSIYDRPSDDMMLYVRSNMKTPSQLRIINGKKDVLVYQSNKQDTKASNIQFEWVKSYNDKGVELKAVLIYPLNYDKNKTYPMVVSIYETQRFESNQFLFDGLSGNTFGINYRTLVENGYFVLLPEIVYDERGTGWSALDCVEGTIKALGNNSHIDFNKIALVGHSHGGYETNFIATQSKLFATYVAGAGNSDLVKSYHSFNYNFPGPFYWQFETGQYRMPGSFTDHKELYIQNSPVYYAEKVNSPILLWTGKEDINIHWEQTMEFYLALRRNNKPVVALFYPEEGHVLGKKKNKIDLYTRIYEWLDFHLKDNAQSWITKLYQ